MKCTDKSFIINTTTLHIKRRFVKFDFMPTLTPAVNRTINIKLQKGGFGNALEELLFLYY